MVRRDGMMMMTYDSVAEAAEKWKEDPEDPFGAPGTIGIFVCEAVFRHASTKRSLNITANCVFASNHSRGGRFQSAAAWFKTKYSSLAAASSDGKWPLVLMARR